VATGQLWQVLRHIRQLVGAPSGDDASDGQLLARFIATRDQDAFAALVERHGPLVWSVCRRALSIEQDAEDVFQATFLVLARKASAIRKHDSVSSWLYGTAYRLATKLRASGAKRRGLVALASDCQRSHDDDVLQEVPSETAAVRPETNTETERQELRSILDEELNLLPEKYRAPLVLCYLQGRTNEQAAQELRWTKGTVSGRLARARDLLRDRLTRRGCVVAGPALPALLAEQAATAAPPLALTKTTIEAAALFAASRTAAAALVSDRVAALAEGVVHTMWMTKVKMASAMLLALVLVGGGLSFMGSRPEAHGIPADDPQTETKKEEGSKTEPPGVPLEAKIVVKKDTYTLDLNGKTADQFETQVKQQAQNRDGNSLPAPLVDLVFELRNTSNKELTIEVVSMTAPSLQLKGPGAIEGMYTGAVPYVVLVPRPVKIPAGQTWSYPIRNLQSGFYGSLSYWTKPGEYTLTASYVLGVSPSPRDIKPDAKGFGRVRVISAPVKLKVVAPKKESRVEPASTPLLGKLVAVRDSYVLDRRGLSVEAYTRAVADLRRRNELMPQVNLVFEVRNTGDKEVRFRLGGNTNHPSRLGLQLTGPGVVQPANTIPPAPESPQDPEVITLAAGASHAIPIRDFYTHSDGQRHWFWTKPGTYELVVRFETSVSPAPTGAEAAGPGFGAVTIHSNSVDLKVTEAGNEARSEPPDAVLQAKIIVKKDTYPLDLGGLTPEEFAAKVSRDFKMQHAHLPKVELVLEVKNTGKEDVTFYPGDNPHGAPCLEFRLQGPGVVKAHDLTLAGRTPALSDPVTLAPGKTYELPIERLAAGHFSGDAMHFWSRPGTYTLAVVLKTAMKPAPAGTRQTYDNGLSAVSIISAPVQLKVMEGKVEPKPAIEARIVAKEDTFTLDVAPEELKKRIEAAKKGTGEYPAVQSLGLTLVLRNNTDKEVELPFNQAASIVPQVKGPGAIDGNSQGRVGGRPPLEVPGVIRIAPGKTATLPLSCFNHNLKSGQVERVYLTEAGDYTLTVNRQFGDFSIASEPFKLKVVEKK